MKEHCGLKHINSKFEHNDPKKQNWWLEKCQEMENRNSFVFEQNLNKYRKVLPDRIFQKLLQVFYIKSKKDDTTFTFDNNSVVDLKVAKSAYTFDTAKSECYTRKLDLDEENDIFYTTQPQFEPYKNFFKRPPEEAAIWYEPKPKDVSMDLHKLSEQTTDKIAKDFYEWLISIGGDQETTISIQGIKEMFDIGSQMSAATTMKIILKEVGSVSQKIAEARNLPEYGRRTKLHNEIMKDRKASKLKKKTIAFGKTLPREWQIIPPTRAKSDKWIKSEKLPKNLQTMATVWQGITHLRITKAYCEYMFKQKPEIKPPAYLLTSGMMDKLTIQLSDESFKTHSSGKASSISFA